MITDKL